MQKVPSASGLLEDRLHPSSPTMGPWSRWPRISGLAGRDRGSQTLARIAGLRRRYLWLAPGRPGKFGGGVKSSAPGVGSWISERPRWPGARSSCPSSLRAILPIHLGSYPNNQWVFPPPKGAFRAMTTSARAGVGAGGRARGAGAPYLPLSAPHVPLRHGATGARAGWTGHSSCR